MKLPVIIGCGNRLREDDGLGRRAAELLRGSRDAEVIECHQLTPELSARIEGAPFVIFLDAAADLEPGEVRCRKVATACRAAWTHHLTPDQLLSLFPEAPSAVVITGGIERMGYGEALSDTAERVAQQMAVEAVRLLSSFRASAPAPGRTTAVSSASLT